MFFISISRSSSVLRISSTYFINFLQSNCIDIESLMSQEISENSEIHNDVIKSWCDSHSRQYHRIQTIDICFMMYFLVNSRYQISHRCFISSRHSIRRNFSDTRSHVLQFDFTSYFKSIRVFDFDSFVFAIFTSMHDLESITLKKFARKLQITHRWKNQNSHRWKNHIVERVCTKTLDWTR